MGAAARSTHRAKVSVRRRRRHRRAEAAGGCVARWGSIRAVILGSAINNDGAQKIGYTAPSVDGQAEAILAAQACAGVAPQPSAMLKRTARRRRWVTLSKSRRSPRRSAPPRQNVVLRDRLGQEQHWPSRCGRWSCRAHQDGAVVEARGNSAEPPFRNAKSADRLRAHPFFVNANLREWSAGPAARRRELIWYRRNECTRDSRRSTGAGAR